MKRLFILLLIMIFICGQQKIVFALSPYSPLANEQKLILEKLNISNKKASSEVIKIWDGKSDLNQLLGNADIVILGAPDSTGTQRNLGFGGSEKGTDAVINELLDGELSEFKGLNVVYLGNIKIPDTDEKTTVTRKDGQEVTFLDALLGTYENIESVVSSVIKINPEINFLQIGGDHGLAYPFNAPFSNRQGRLGFVNVDAHFDSRDPQDTSRPEGPNSGTPFRYLLEEGHTYGENAIFLGIDKDNLYAAPLEEYVRSMGAEIVLSYQEIMKQWEQGTETFTIFIDKIIEKAVLGVETGHISFCIDVVNEEEAPGCSARNKNGLSGDIVKFMAKRAGMNAKIHSIGIFEIIPDLDDPDRRTIKLGVDIILEYFRGTMISKKVWDPVKNLELQSI